MATSFTPPRAARLPPFAGVYHPAGPTFSAHAIQALVDRAQLRSARPQVRPHAFFGRPGGRPRDDEEDRAGVVRPRRLLRDEGGDAPPQGAVRRRVVGLDFSEGMLAEVKRNVEGAAGTARPSARPRGTLASTSTRRSAIVTSVGAFRAHRREGRGPVRRRHRPGARTRRALRLRDRRMPRVGSGLDDARGFNAVMRVGTRCQIRRSVMCTT